MPSVNVAWPEARRDPKRDPVRGRHGKSRMESHAPGQLTPVTSQTQFLFEVPTCIRAQVELSTDLVVIKNQEPTTENGWVLLS